MMEGFASFPGLAASGLEVHRTAWPRPRAEILGLRGRSISSFRFSC
ncbi:hypothetical protein [Saliniramus sp.]|nr:hypothetical protein [Saliniramus sp.]HMB09382.1 hypothetical protein [Saliniramus sp.]